MKRIDQDLTIYHQIIKLSQAYNKACLADIKAQTSHAYNVKLREKTECALTKLLIAIEIFGDGNEDEIQN